MPYPSSAVGLVTAPRTREITTRTILAYAAGLGADEPAFLDDAQGVFMLPFQCVSCEWPLVLDSRHVVPGALTDADARRGVHAIQDSLFHQPARAGATLRTTARVVSARATRAGALSVTRLDTVDARDGQPVFTSWFTSIHRGVALDGADRSVEDASPPPPHTVGAAARIDVIPIPRTMPHVYSECADIWNPIHTERAVALAAGLPDIILHGTATWALAGLAILRRDAACDAPRLKRLHGRFTGMAIPGRDIHIRSEPPGADGVVRFDVVTADGAPILSDGLAVLT